MEEEEEYDEEKVEEEYDGSGARPIFACMHKVNIQLMTCLKSSQMNIS